jgi:hypothetical protein
MLASELPENAVVLDLGAGASNLGETIANMRPDVSWTNLDYNYDKPEVARSVDTLPLANLSFVTGDATQLLESCEPETYDAILSYWLFPHLSLDSPEPALAAGRGVYDALKEGGVASVGPRINLGHLATLRWRRTYHAFKGANVDRDEFAERILQETQLTPIFRRYRQLKYEIWSDYFGTTRWRKDGRKLIYAPSRGEYVPTKSIVGAKVVGGLGAAAARHLLHDKRND